jgi:hypothetical protein
MGTKRSNKRATLSWPKGRNKSGKGTDTLGLASGVWFCTVPLIFFLAVLFFDLKVALLKSGCPVSDHTSGLQHHL